MKRQIKLKIYNAKDRSRFVEYDGRFLGIIDNKVFHRAVKEPLFLRRLLSVETANLESSLNSGGGIDGRRLAFHIKQKEKHTSSSEFSVVHKNALFITEKIAKVTSKNTNSFSASKIVGTTSENRIYTVRMRMLGEKESVFELSEFYRIFE